MDEIVSLENVSVYFNGVPILEDINLSIKQDDFLAIIGPNGGGKTTLLKVILGLIKPSKGKVKVFGKSPEEGRKLIGYLPQYVSFDPNFPISVFEVVLMGRYKGVLQGFSEEDKNAALNALKIVDCQEVVLINNTVMFCGSSLEIIQSDKLRVVGNVFSNVTYLGSSFAESSLILFQGNTISSASTGLYMLSVRDVTISGNNISNANTGIVISNNDAGGSNIKVMMNNLLNCSTSATSNAGATWSGNYFDKASDNPLVISDTDVDYEPSSKMIVDTKPPRLLSLNATKTLDGTRLSFDIDEPFGIVEFIFFYEKMEYFPLFNYSSGFWYIVMATNCLLYTSPSPRD